jgi:hypothetical protein
MAATRAAFIAALIKTSAVSSFKEMARQDDGNVRSDAPLLGRSRGGCSGGQSGEEEGNSDCDTHFEGSVKNVKKFELIGKSVLCYQAV